LSQIFEFSQSLINDALELLLYPKKILQNEYDKLLEEHTKLKVYLMQMADVESENHELKNKLNIKKNYFKESIVTQILNLNYNGKSHHFLIDKGEIDEVQTGQIVVDQSGIAGQVIEVNNDILQ
jgi:rod shape-determining protein MreC